VLHGWHLHASQKRGAAVGKTKRGKGTKLMVLADGQGTPLGIHVEAASPSEVKLLEPTLENLAQVNLERQPERLIADRAYDSNAVRGLLEERGIEPIIPARRNNRKATHQDGRKLRRYKHRWIIERTNAWLQNFRRLTVRYERSVVVFTAIVHLVCALICLNRVLG
jgi:transposase